MCWGGGEGEGGRANKEGGVSGKGEVEMEVGRNCL